MLKQSIFKRTVFTVLFVIRNWEQPKYSAIRIIKTCRVIIVKQFIATREIYLYALTWENLQDIL